MTSKPQMPAHSTSLRARSAQAQASTNLIYTKLSTFPSRKISWLWVGIYSLMWLCLRSLTGHLNNELVLRGIIFPQIDIDFANKKLYNYNYHMRSPCSSPPQCRFEQGHFFIIFTSFVFSWHCWQKVYNYPSSTKPLAFHHHPLNGHQGLCPKKIRPRYNSEPFCALTGLQEK